MIREEDLIDAISECQGVRNPNASTAIKLASYYTILDHIKKDLTQAETAGYSYEAPPYTSESDFGKVVGKLGYEETMRIFDELMETLRIMQPRLYEAVMRKLTALE